MERKKIIQQIDTGYKRINKVLFAFHFEIAKKILLKLHQKSAKINYTKGVNEYFIKI